jgi:hypothetical protein
MQLQGDKNHDLFFQKFPRQSLRMAEHNSYLQKGRTSFYLSKTPFAEDGLL